MKIPKKIKNNDCCHIANLCIYTGNFFTATRIATKAAKAKKTHGFAVHDGKRVYWCLLRLKNHDSIFR